MFDSMNGIITGGMGVGLPACCSLITMKFHLGKRCNIEITPVVPPQPLQTSGGSLPMAPGSAKNFYQVVGEPRVPIDTHAPYYIQTNIENKAGQFTFTIQWDDKDIVKNYIIPNNSGRILIKLLQINDMTRTKIKVISSNIINVTNKVKVLFHKYTKIR